MIVMSLFFLFPVIWMLANSFKTDAAITRDMNSLAAFIPPALNGSFFDNYITILINTSFLRYMANTLLYAVVRIVLGIIVNGLAGYALAKINFPFNIFLFRQVFVSIPDDVYEAAQLDFCSPVKYFFTMELPMSKSVVATVSVFTFLNVWNDYLWPSLVFTSSDLLTAQIGLNAITSNDNTTMGQTLAVITLVTIARVSKYELCKVGDKVEFVFVPHRMHFFDIDTEEAIEL